MKIKKYNIREFIDYSIIILIILCSADVTNNLSNSLALKVFSFFYVFFIYLNRGNKINSKIIIRILLAVFTYLIINYIKFNQIHLIFIFKLISYFLIPVFAIKIMGYKIFEKFVNLVVKLSIIRFPFYILQLISFEFTFSLIKNIQNAIPFLAIEGDSNYANILIWGIEGDGAELRNCGFMWEPGAFAALLAISLLLQLLKDKFKLSSNSLILSIAMITTFSTMGYFALFILLIYFFYNKKFSLSYIIIIPLIILSFFMINNLSFMNDKVFNEIDNIDYTIKNNILKRGKDSPSFGRMGSLIMDYYTWQKNPFFGVGGHDEAIEFSIIYKDTVGFVNRTNGDSEYLVRFGILGSFLFLIFTFFSSKKILSMNNAKGNIILTAILLIIGFSNTILFTPLINLFYVFSFTDSNIDLN